MSAEISFSDEIKIEPFTGPIEVNVADQFSTNKVFEQRNDLIKWAQEVANGLGFILTIQKSDGLNSRPCPRVFLGCDRSGSYREKQASSTRMKKGIRRSSTKRCGCPFSLKAKKVNGLDQWKVEVVCGVHNHKGSSYLEGHSFAGKLNMEQKKILKDMSRVGIKPRDVLRTIKKKDPINVTTIRTIYNARAAIRLEELGGKTPIQHLFKCLNDLGYVTFHRMDEKNKNLTDLFFSHPTSVKLSRAFPNVFLLDCTYKTNRFRLPLLSIVGVTSTDRTFFSAFAFLSSETEVSYTWALESFKSVLNPKSLPLVLVTDRELALINAIKTVFPTSKNLLCLWHISKNVLANCKKCFNEEEIFDKFMQDWNALARSPTEADYNHALMSMTRDFSLYPKVFAYIMLTWLNPYKEFFVSAWTDQYFHIGASSDHSLFIKKSERDVVGDGHCGFRAVAGLMGMGEEGWRKVRTDLAYELQKHSEQYANLFGDLQREESPWLLEPWMDPKNGDTFKSDPDIYSLDADGALFDAALLSQLLPFLIFTVVLIASYGRWLHIPAVSLNDDGRFVAVSEHGEGKQAKETVNKEKRKLALDCIPFSLTCLLYKKYILADPTAEEESIMETLVTVVLDSSNQLVSLYKPGGPVLAYTSAVKVCIHLLLSSKFDGSRLHMSNATGYSTPKHVPLWELLWFSVVANMSITGMNLSFMLNSGSEDGCGGGHCRRGVCTVTDVKVNAKGFLCACVAILSTSLQ
ncbi:hypothetical protein HHK36_027290 [Tetracentron sinense]|uniref:Protein FAR1-RELATED SEQUENCE n=1 Tax=Tetracentron sinense TaxID=13715 RepID=A0A834YKX3_TETSI|nr:hypothetical protein HHK36_027290 [Tetracentron sinense]